LSEMREKAKGIQDAEVRDNVTQRIEHEWSVREAINRQDEENALKGAFNILDKTPDIHKIPPTAWVSFTGAQRGALMAYADKLSAGTPVETDYPTYYSLMTQAGKDPTTFANANLLNYRAKLGDTEFKQLTDIQLSIRNKDNAKADRDLGDFRTKDQIVTDSLIKFGITTDDSKLSTDQRRALAELRQLVDTRTTAQANLTGKKPTGQDIQSIVDQILSSSISRRSSRTSRRRTSPATNGSRSRRRSVDAGGRSTTRRCSISTWTRTAGPSRWARTSTTTRSSSWTRPPRLARRTSTTACSTSATPRGSSSFGRPSSRRRARRRIVRRASSN